MALQFSSLGLERRDEYRRLYDLCPRKSTAYSFGTLWSWRQVHDFQWAFADGLCWIRAGNRLWSPVGPWEDIPWEDILPRYFPDGVEFLFAPDGFAEALVRSFGPYVVCTEDRDQWEYIHSVQELTALRGNRFSRKRSHIYQFVRKYPFTYRSIGDRDADPLLECQRLWMAEHAPSPQLEMENVAIGEMMGQWRNIPGLLGGLLDVGGRVVAYTVAEILSPDTIMIHFEKALLAYNGAYQAIHRLFLKEDAQSFSRVNREEDTGDHGLRTAKMSYFPVEFLKKYRVRWNSG